MVIIIVLWALINFGKESQVLSALFLLVLRVEATSYGDFQVVFINVTNNPQTMT